MAQAFRGIAQTDIERAVDLLFDAWTRGAAPPKG